MSKRLRRHSSTEERHLRRLLELAPDAMVVVDQAGIIVLANSQADTLFGYRQQEVLGSHVEVLIPKRFRETHRGHRINFFSEPRVRPMGAKLQLFGLRKDGTEFPVEISLSPVQSAEGMLVVTAIRDVSERKIAEEALHESEERLRLAVQAGKMFAYSWDAATDVIQRSGDSEDILGVKSDQAATGAAISAMVHPDDKQRLEAALSNLKVENPTLQITYRLIRPDGAVAWLERNSRAYFDEQGKLKRVVGMIADVTERKRAEEIRFRHAAVIESSDNAIATGTLDGNIVSWNAGAQKIYGYTEAEAIGKPINMLVPPELPDEENKILETLRSGGSIEHLETIRVDKTGKRINVSLTISPIKDSSGRIVSISGIARDISDRKKHEERLREYERAVENAEEMIAVVDREYRYLIANCQFLKMRNKTQEQVVGHSVNQVLNEGVFETFVKPQLDECFQGKVVRYEMKYRYPELGERDLLISYFPIEGAGGIDRAACILQDITERKRAEDALVELNRSLEEQSALLQSSEELLKIFVKNVPVGVAMFDRDMRYLQVSDRWCADYSVDSSHVVGRSHYEVFPDMPEWWKEVHRRALAGETLRADEDRWDRDGGATWVRWEVRPWKTATETVGGILILAEDITHRKRTEESLAEMSRKLIEAQEKERARIGRELHDDINQRLAMLAVELEQPQDPSEFQNRMQGFREELRQISNDVQALSHDLHSSKLEYLGAIAGMKSWCKEFAERQKMDVDFRSDVRNVLPLDVGRPLFRVLQEAMHNAFKHSGAKRIEVQLRENPSEIQMIVSDSGQGFDVETALQGEGQGLV